MIWTFSEVGTLIKEQHSVGGEGEEERQQPEEGELFFFVVAVFGYSLIGLLS